VKKLADNDITSLLIEGGSGIATGFLNAGLVDRVCCFVAPKVIGSDGLAWAGNLGITSANKSISLEDVQIQLLGDDVCIEGRCVYGNR
jgi:diaminohydroxyphosphoribosylaminopyrimidine deaminase/5-amino-6-(5-phosphoribosylamino)uracil reductase